MVWDGRDMKDHPIPTPNKATCLELGLNLIPALHNHLQKHFKQTIPHFGIALGPQSYRNMKYLKEF